MTQQGSAIGSRGSSRRTIHPAILSLSLALVPFAALAKDLELTIPNELNHTWPGELVSFDLEDKKIPPGELSLEVQGTTRPAQRDGDRIWSYVSISNTDEEGQKIDISSVPAILKSQKSAPGITIEKEGDFYRIDNGTYEFRLRNFDGKRSQAVPLGEYPHWCGGMRTKSQEKWDGNAYFESTAPVLGATTELIRSGPVFVDFRITYHFEGETDGEVEAMPLALGKQSHLFEPNRLPRESIPKREFQYELLIRFVMDDIWIDVNERFHFPRDEEANPYGISHYYIEWGDKGGLPVDTVSWVRWFEYDQFGGNTDQKYVPARPRPAQKGRPFALLRPRWNQGGGGAQDFVLTSGGAAPGRNREAGNGYAAENPAVGIVAAYPSKWIGPYANYIPVYAHDGNRGKARFPLTDGERSGMHCGQRAWGLLVGPRKKMENLNSVVRRHTDWTLTAQINKYILSWKRDPKKAGPNILLTRDELKRFQEDYRSGRKTPLNDALRAKAEEWSPLEEERDAILADYEKRESALVKELEKLGQRAKERDAPKSVKAEARERENELKNLRRERKDDPKLKELGKKLKGLDFDLHRLITTGEKAQIKLPSSELWRARRYQDDFLNPTSSPTRSIPNIATADLFAAGEPIGGADQAAMGYIATDLDAWPGWHQGWSPGNPNFHTDKYMAAMFIGGALRDHPHADEWLQFGFENFKEDAAKVFLAPDGVGAECPGYSGYAMKLQLEIARILKNTGFGNALAADPLVKGNAVWHRKLITPYDSRIQRRHEAPIGDTHRWDAGLKASGFAKLAHFYKEEDPEFASELMGAWKLLSERGEAQGGESSPLSLKEQLVGVDGEIPITDPKDLDWSSQAFEGFGAVLRDGFGTASESFLSYKAGRARGHYHNDENSYHFYSGGTPISLDYNCSYTPRGDHAALHNTMTFGLSSTIRHNGDGRNVPAQEEITSSAKVTHFRSEPVADLVVSERSSSRLILRPLYPLDNEFGRNYPEREVPSITHRRQLLFVKNDDRSPLGDYLVVRDESDSTERQQLNIHLLAREITPGEDGRTFTAPGQYDKDMVIFLAEATEPETTISSWHYRDEWMLGPEDYHLRKGESREEWTRRMTQLMQENKVESLPLPGWEPVYQNPKEESSRRWATTIEETNGEALMPPPFWKGPWMYGEHQKWLKIETRPGTPMTWILYPFPKGGEAPSISVSESGVTIRSGDQSDTIRFAGDGAITLVRNGDSTRLR